MLVALKRTGCDVWQLECQASKITASVQSDHLESSVWTVFLPLIKRVVHHAVFIFSPCYNKPLPQLVRIADWYSIRMHAPSAGPLLP